MVNGFIDTCLPAGYLKSMENYFDIATKQEIAARFPTASKRSEWLASCRESAEMSHDRNCSLLAELWFYRGDNQKADYYLDQIRDEQTQLAMSMLLYECRDD